MEELHLQHLLRTNGLQHTVLTLNLFHALPDVKSDTDGRVLFKYRQIDADFRKKAVNEARGIILDQYNNWEVISYPYDKFFNIGEPLYKELDWDSVKIYDKADGTLVTAYFYNGEWKFQTSRLMDANYGYTYDTTFYDLCVMSINDMYGDFDKFMSTLDKNLCYMFELCTPENVVVTPHDKYRLLLHGARDLRTLKEISIDDEMFSEFIKCKFYNISTIEQMKDLITDMDWTKEGFICVDKNFNRGKLKNPKYVTMHYSSTGVSKYSVLDIIRANELDEYFVYFKSKQEHYTKMQVNYFEFIKNLENAFESVKHIDDKKEFALEVTKKYKGHYKSYCFAKNGKPDLTAKEFIDERINNRDLFKIIGEETQLTIKKIKK